MKLGKKALTAIYVLLVAVVGILGNVLANHFPDLPPLALWAGGIAIIATFIIVSIIYEEKADKTQAQDPGKPSEKIERPSDSSASQNNQKRQQAPQPTRITHLPPGTMPTASSPNGEPGQPTVDKPLLLCLAIDVSRSMKKPIINHTGKTIERWATVQDALEEFIHLGAAWVKDPETQSVLPLYHLTAYGFGFREVMHSIGMRKAPGGAVRDLFAHPSLPSLPSALDLSEHWKDYKDHLLSVKEYTGDLFGLSPLCQALKIIRDRIKEERKQHNFTLPILLLIISDGLADDGDPLPLIAELHSLDVMTLSCYLADKDVLAPRQLYNAEDPSWTDGAKLLFRCASPLHQDTYVSRAIFDYLDNHGWHPGEGVRLFAQANQAEALDSFLKVLLQASATERSA